MNESKTPGPDSKTPSPRVIWILTAISCAIVAVCLFGFYVALRPNPSQQAQARGLLLKSEAEHSAGRHGEAALLLSKALAISPNDELRGKIAPRLARCINEMEDAKTAFELAQKATILAPDQSFGKYDYPVARAFRIELEGLKLVDKFSLSAKDWIQVPSRADAKNVEFAIHRFDIVLRTKLVGEEQLAEAKKDRQALLDLLDGTSSRGYTISFSSGPISKRPPLLCRI